MTKSKKELVEEILSIREVDTKSNLMKKSVAQLEGILEGLKSTPTQEQVTVTASVPQIDIETLMAKMKEEMLAELKEQARKEVEAELKTEKSEAVEMPVKPASSKREIDRFEQIPVMNVTNGKLVYTSRKTGAEWIFSQYGDIEYMEFQELLTMRSSQRRFFDEPFILVMDDDAVEYLGLTKMYANIKNPQHIDDVFKLPQTEFEEVVEKSPKGIKHLIVSRAKELYEKGELESIKKINYLNKRFNTDIGQRG
jgi:phage pi2 protein 07